MALKSVPFIPVLMLRTSLWIHEKEKTELMFMSVFCSCISVLAFLHLQALVFEFVFILILAGPFVFVFVLIFAGPCICIYVCN